MTIEEAGQVLLENLPIHVCQACKGQGWVNKKNAQVGDPVSFTPEGETVATKDCVDCKAVGHTLNTAYAEACAVLGMEVPADIKYLVETPWTKRLQGATAAAVGLPMGYITGVGNDGEGTVRGKRTIDVLYHAGAADHIYR